MSPVNRASSVVEISPGRTGPVTEISVFATEISETGMKIFLYKRSSPVTETTLFRQTQLRFRNTATTAA